MNTRNHPSTASPCFSPGTRFRQSPQVVASKLDGETTLFQCQTCDYLVLMGSATAIWEALCTSPNLEELCTILHKDFEITEEDLLKDVCIWLQEAISKKVVVTEEQV